MSIETAVDWLPSPPLASGLPVLGNTPAIQQDLVRFLVEQYKRLGPVFRIRALNQEFVVMAGPDRCQYLCDTRGSR